MLIKLKVGNFMDNVEILKEVYEIVRQLFQVEEGDKNLKILKEIYEKIGYKIIFTQAKNEVGIQEVKEIINGKVTVFCLV